MRFTTHLRFVRQSRRKRSTTYLVGLCGLALTLATPGRPAAQDATPAVTETAGETAAAPALPQTKSASDNADTDFRVYWDNGLRFATKDKAFKLKLGGRIQNDWAWFIENNGINSSDGTEFRRARLYAAGQIYKTVDYKIEVDFASSSPFKDVYIAYKDIPYIGTIKVGHFKEPFSLNELTSSKYIALMERALPNVFVPARNTGIQWGTTQADERMTLAVGLFRDADGIGEGTGEKNYALTSRITGLVLNDGDNLVHIGGAVRYHRSGQSESYSVRPESHLAARYLTTPGIQTKHKINYNGEIAAVWDALHVSAEYIGAFHDAPVTDVHGGSVYGQIGYFFTGESRPFKKSAAAFSRLTPEKSVFDGGPGAIEGLLRVSHLDLDDGGFQGGKLLAFNAGLNWYLNANAKIALNYVLADPDGADPGHIVQSRFQVDF